MVSKQYWLTNKSTIGEIKAHQTNRQRN
jgi:hypothetical protein